MVEYYNIAMLVLVVIFGYILVSPKFRTWVKQDLTDRKRARAHAGKVDCEDGVCDKVAVRLTPNGYFCEDHWEENSKKTFESGGYVRWSHVLNHSIRRS